jgi:hypothetical protein
MELTLTEIDRFRLQSLRIGRLVEVLPSLGGLLMSIVEQALCIELPYGLLQVAALALGTNQIELYESERLLCRLSLESVKSSNNTPTHITMNTAAVLEREATTPTTDSLISWKTIAAKTGEGEAHLKKRSHELGINFYWIGEGDDWGVLIQDAKALASRYYIDMGQAIALSLGGPATDIPFSTTAPKQPELSPAKEKRRSPKPPIDFKGEFKPTKNPKVTVERYLAAVAPDKSAQILILHEIVTDAGISRRHLNKLTANMSADLKDSTTRAKLQAAFTNLHERMTASKQPAPALPPDAADTSEID